MIIYTWLLLIRMRGAFKYGCLWVTSQLQALHGIMQTVNKMCERPSKVIRQKWPPSSLECEWMLLTTSHVEAYELEVKVNVIIKTYLKPPLMTGLIHAVYKVALDIGTHTAQPLPGGLACELVGFAPAGSNNLLYVGLRHHWPLCRIGCGSLWFF